MKNDEFADADTPVNRIQIYSDSPSTANAIRPLEGQQVEIAASEIFGAHTAHHHAPLVARIQSIARADAGPAPGAATVEGFYLSLAAGSGTEAVRFVVPEKRETGPLSASAISSFYGALSTPLRLISLTPEGPGTFRVHYTYRTRPQSACDGRAIVRVERRGNAHLIAGIRALDGC